DIENNSLSILNIISNIGINASNNTHTDKPNKNEINEYFLERTESSCNLPSLLSFTSFGFILKITD
ncbi:hypothetical protein AB4586_25835, partial [Vibrio sp. 10N.222.49.E4]|uniref:hypothetical protein n=1 Tax=Vibrio sp. 10N.222.49.E4 TaxID=3229616 RepID=UPI00354B1984